nr:hypothetical protein BaRGS_018767 [Batillaria attramentaria]
MADFILEFRFEYLWPFWLLVRSVYDSFKYQGLGERRYFTIFINKRPYCKFVLGIVSNEEYAFLQCLSGYCLSTLRHQLESDVKKLKADLQSSRNTEQELRVQINSLLASEKSTRSELYQLQQDNENLQNK